MYVDDAHGVPGTERCAQFNYSNKARQGFLYSYNIMHPWSSRCMGRRHSDTWRMQISRLKLDQHDSVLLCALVAS